MNELVTAQGLEDSDGVTWLTIARANAKTRSSARRVPVTGEMGRALLRAWVSLVAKVPAKSQSSSCSNHLKARGLSGVEEVNRTVVAAYSVDFAAALADLHGRLK